MGAARRGKNIAPTPALPLRGREISGRLFAWLALGLFVGCSQQPARIAAPDWDPDGFADAILEKLDKNGDGALEQSELAPAAGLVFGAKYIDKNGDQSLSYDELVDRFEMYRKMKLGLTSKSIQLVYKGRPVVGAKVKLVPEFFLADVIEPAVGEAIFEGTVDPLIEGQQPPGMRVGYYRVVVESSPRVKLPAKYSSAETTTLGVEVAPISDDPETYGTIRLNIAD